MILVDKVSKSYGSNKVLSNVTFAVEGGEFVSITGPSGAGKSTLIHAMIGAETIDEGSISIDQFVVNQLKGRQIQDYRRKIGIVFQDYKLLPKKTVYENVSFALEVAGYPKSFIGKRTMDVLRLTGLEQHRNNFPDELSGGEQQRTAIARALVHAPELLIADEPSGNLDPENTQALAKLLQKINTHGTTVILATHNKELVNSVKKRVITLDKGKLTSDKKNSQY